MALVVQTASVSRLSGRTTGEKPCLQPSTACRCHCRDADKGLAEGCSSQRKAYNRRYLLNHFPILALLCGLSSEPWLHAHGITVTHHSAGNTKTSSWLRSEKAPTHTSRSRPNVKMKIAMMTVWEPLFLHGLPTHKSFFVDLSTADVRLRLGPGYSQRPHQRQLRADSEG